MESSSGNVSLTYSPNTASAEVSFSIVGAIVTGMIGVSVDPVPQGRETQLLNYFAGSHVRTLSQLTAASSWAVLQHLPVKSNDVSIRHEGISATEFTNNHGPALVWEAAFAGRFDELMVNGTRVKATRLSLPAGREASAARVVVPPGAMVRVSIAH